MRGHDPSALIRELLHVTRELEELAELGDDARASIDLLEAERERILVELRSVMGSEAPPRISISENLVTNPSGIRTKSGRWATPSPARSRRKGPR